MLSYFLDTNFVGFDINCTNNQGQTPLHCACIGDHAEAAQVLVNRNADITLKDKLGFSPFKVACEFSNKAVAIAMLHAMGFLVDSIDSHLVHEVCKRGTVCLMDQLLTDYCFNPLLLTNEIGNELIHTASLHGNKAKVKLLVHKYKFFINMKNASGQTPLHVACSQKPTDLKFINVLINEFHADPSAIDNEKDTPLNKVIKIGDAKSVHALASKCSLKASFKGCKSRSLLHQLCAGDYAIMLQDFISNFKYDPASLDDDHNTILHIAALHGSVAVLLILVDNCVIKCLINAANMQGQTPLHCACIGGYAEAAKVLVHHKADVTSEQIWSDSVYN